MPQQEVIITIRDEFDETAPEAALALQAGYPHGFELSDLFGSLGKDARVTVSFRDLDGPAANDKPDMITLDPARLDK